MGKLGEGKLCSLSACILTTVLVGVFAYIVLLIWYTKTLGNIQKVMTIIECRLYFPQSHLYG